MVELPSPSAGDDRIDLPPVRFVPGTAVGLVGPRLLGLVVDDPRSDLVKRLWASMRQGAGLDEVVEEIAGSGVLQLPALALAAPESEGVRLIVRGEVLVVLEVSGTGPLSISGEGVKTWVEHAEPRVASVQLQLADDLSELGAFEVASGLFPAGRLALRIDDEEEVAEVASLSPPGPSLALEPPSMPSPWYSVAKDLPPPVQVIDDGVAEEGDVVLPDDGVEEEDAVGGEDGVDAEGAVAGEHAVDTEDAADAAPTADPTPSVQVSGDAPPSSDEQMVPPAHETVAPPHSPPSPTASPGIDTLIGPFDADVPHDDGAVQDSGVEPASASTVPDVDSSAPEVASREHDEYDHLFGATQFRTVEDAAVRSDEDGNDGSNSGLISSIPGFSSATPPPAGDHDGHTVTLGELQRMRSAATDAAAAPSQVAGANLPTPQPGQPVVHAISCASGHLNPTHATVCRVCAGSIQEQDHITVPRPVLGVLRFGDGRSVALSGPLLIGRSPRAEGAISGELPELVSVPSPLKEVSGTHLEVRLEGWQVLVVDRQSTNGTVVKLPGREPRRLHPGEPHMITPGATVSLADEAEFRFEASE